MRYSKGALPKNTSENAPEFSGGAKGISLPAVSVLQKTAPEEELQMKRIIQKAAPEEELQMKSVVQKAAAEEGLQLKAVVQKAASEEELQMKRIIQKATPEEELQLKAVVQKAASEEELQMKRIIQKAAPEEELQMKAVVQKAAPEEELQMKSIVQKASPEEELQMKSVIQKVAAPEEELQMKSMVQRKENKTGMPDQLKSGIENLSGMDMSEVKVHYNSPQPAQLQALAYAQGNDIHIGPGQEQHLAHEAWHVVQQRQGRVKPTMQMKESVAVNDDPGLEHEADVMGAKALQQKSVQLKADGIIQYVKPFYQHFKSIDAQGTIHSHKSAGKYRSHAEGAAWIRATLAGLPGHSCHGKPTISR